MLDLAGRLYPFLNKLKAENGPTTLLVCHGGICRMIRTYFLDVKNTDYAAFKLPNCRHPWSLTVKKSISVSRDAFLLTLPSQCHARAVLAFDAAVKPLASQIINNEDHRRDDP